MKTLAYKFTITNGREWHELKIIAHNTVEAICVGMRTSLPISGPVRISCKPQRRMPA